MKELLEIIGGVLAFAIVMIVIQFVFDPPAAQKTMITIINVAANVWHAATDAFSR